jgi:hypothetical protein
MCGEQLFLREKGLILNLGTINPQITHEKKSKIKNT